MSGETAMTPAMKKNALETFGEGQMDMQAILVDPRKSSESRIFKPTGQS